jgi:hypothetical protein
VVPGREKSKIGLSLSDYTMGMVAYSIDPRKVWDRMIEAEVRSMYFAALASRYTLEKQCITFGSFFLASGAAVTIYGKSPSWVPLVFTTITALASAYSVAFGLDRRARTMANLQQEWSVLQYGYERLYRHLDDHNAEEVFDQLVERARKASDSTEAPYDEALIDKWTDRVYARYEQKAA